MTRHLRLEAVENFRDFGDYATASGRRMKAKRFYRSASHGRATDADLAAIEALGLALIVDLRRPAERADSRPQYARIQASRACGALAEAGGLEVALIGLVSLLTAFWLVRLL